jgi:hypothetical protein
VKTSRRILTFLASLLAVGLIATAGVAVTRPPASVGEVATSEWESETTCGDEGVPVAETDAPDADTELCGEGDGTGEEGDPGPGEGSEQSPEEDGSGGDDAPDEEEPGADGPGDDESDAVDPIREAACNEAGGVTPAPEEGGDTADSATRKPRGLDNAIAHVLANCTSNPRASGLLVALRHLVANKAKHDAHEDAKANAKAEATAKAKAKRAGHGAGAPASRGNPPGNSGAQGNGGAAGRGVSGNGQGGSASHGNPHGD